MSPDAMERASAAALEWLAAQDSPESAIAAHEAGTAPSDEDARRWVRRLLDGQGPEGAWEADLAATARTLLTIGELRDAASLREQDPGISRALDWLRSRKGAPGAWSDGCSEGRHARGLCHHFAGGLFSPAPPETILEQGRLHAGAEVTGDEAVRLVASVTALRALLAWNDPSADGVLHLAVLRRLVELWVEGEPMGLSPTAILEAVHALLRSPADEDRAAAERGLLLIAGRQRGDGSWVDLDPFHAFEVFAAAAEEGVASERAGRALWHGARLLTSSQQVDGSWGREQGARRALIATRTLRRVAGAA